MSKIDWARRNREYLCQHRGVLNIRDEEQMLERSTDRATRYLSKQEQQRTKIIAAKPRKSGGAFAPRKPRIARSFGDLNPRDPHDQLAGADLSTPPWD